MMRIVIHTHWPLAPIVEVLRQREQHAALSAVEAAAAATVTNTNTHIHHHGDDGSDGNGGIITGVASRRVSNATHTIASSSSSSSLLSSLSLPISSSLSSAAVVAAVTGGRGVTRKLNVASLALTLAAVKRQRTSSITSREIDWWGPTLLEVEEVTQLLPPLVNIVISYLRQYAITGRQITHLGDSIKGHGAGQFAHPYAVAFHNATGRIFIRDARNPRIQVFSGTGMYLNAFAVGRLPHCPLATGGICIDQVKEELFVLDQKQIQVYNLDGRQLRVFDNPRFPIDSWGNLCMSTVNRSFYVPSRDGQEVLRVTCDTGMITASWTVDAKLSNHNNNQHHHHNDGHDGNGNNHHDLDLNGRSYSGDDLHFTPVCIDVLALDHQSEVILVAEDASIGRILVFDDRGVLIRTLMEVSRVGHSLQLIAGELYIASHNDNESTITIVNPHTGILIRTLALSLPTGCLLYYNEYTGYLVVPLPSSHQITMFS